MGSSLENLRDTILSKAQANSKNHYNPTGGWQLMLGGGCFLVFSRFLSGLSTSTQRVLLNPAYGIKDFWVQAFCLDLSLCTAPGLLPQLLAIMFLQHLLLNSFKSGNCPPSKKSCRHVLEKLDVSGYQYDFLLRIAKLFPFALSLQAILMNLVCVDQRGYESTKGFTALESHPLECMLEVGISWIFCSSFFLPLPESDHPTVSLYVQTEGRSHSFLFSKYLNGFD